MKGKALGLMLALLTLVGCASLPAKERATISLRSVQGQLEVLQDTERRLCNPASFDNDPSAPITACAGKVAQDIGLTTAKHQEFAGHMASAYAAQRRVAVALQAWQVGQPTPPELTTLENQVRSGLALARTLARTQDQQALVASADAALAAVLKIVEAIKN